MMRLPASVLGSASNASPESSSARLRGVIASISAATCAGEATGRSLARSEPAPWIWHGLRGTAPSRTAPFMTARRNRYDWAIKAPLARRTAAPGPPTRAGFAAPALRLRLRRRGGGGFGPLLAGRPHHEERR